VITSNGNFFDTGIPERLT